MKQVSITLCLFVAAACGWLAVMENVLKHPGYVGRTAVDLCLATQAIGAFLYLLLNLPSAFRAVALLCAVATAVFGGFSVMSVLRAQHFEGYILLVGVALLLQGAFTLATFFRMRTRQPA